MHWHQRRTGSCMLTIGMPAARCCTNARCLAPRGVQEAELEGLLFGRDEEALQQLGREGPSAAAAAAGGAADEEEEAGGSLADFLRSYAAGAAAAEVQADVGEGEERGAGRGLLMFEDRAGAAGSTQQQQAGQGQQQQQRRRPVWEDPQDANIRVNVAARSQLRKLRQTEEEAVLTGVHLWLAPDARVLRPQQPSLYCFWSPLCQHVCLPSQPPELRGHNQLGGQRCVQPSGGTILLPSALKPPCHPSLPSLLPSSR